MLTIIKNLACAGFCADCISVLMLTITILKAESQLIMRIKKLLSSKLRTYIIPITALLVIELQGELILHSDQGVQFTSKAFTEFCKENNIIQSMNKAGYPYDNAPMKRYFNTLKNECINLYEFKTEEALYKAVSDFAYVEYNYARPHSYNNYATPHEARIA